jgi:hypothetical protein
MATLIALAAAADSSRHADFSGPTTSAFAGEKLELLGLTVD